jgi:cation diffusion facilitator family transporter
MSFSNEKQKAAVLSICSNTLLITSKFIVGVFTNSVSIISEAVHSFTDLLAAVIAFISIKKSSAPADLDHQYGHGKYEDFSGFAEGSLIILAAGYIMYESIEKILTQKIDYIDSVAGIAVMAMSVVVNIFVSKHLFKIAAKNDSMALLADAEHLRTDILTSAGVLLGLILIKTTGIKILDPLAAIFVAVLILKTGFGLCSASLGNLLDTSLPENEKEIIQNVLNGYCPDKIFEFNQIKTRKAGADRLIEFTIVVSKNLTVEKSHKLCDEIETELKTRLKNAKITIHTEPCDGMCKKCNSNKLCE